MDHIKAVNGQFAERYLLKDMTAVEAEEFERHYFECGECARAVEACQLFAANAQAVLAEMEISGSPAKNNIEAHRKSFWEILTAWWTKSIVMSPAVAALAVVLGAVTVFQGAVIIPSLRHAVDDPHILPALQLAGQSRGEASPIAVPRGTPWFVVAGDIPPDAPYPSFTCSLIAGGRTLFDLTADKPANGEPITIQIPVKDMPAGTYELAIYGLDASGKKGNRVSNSAFELKFR